MVLMVYQASQLEPSVQPRVRAGIRPNYEWRFRGILFMTGCETPWHSAAVRGETVQ